MPDAAQAQVAVVFSLGLSEYEAVRTKLGSTEASLEDVRPLLDRSSSSIAEDMRGEVQLSWRRVGTWPAADSHIATRQSRQGGVNVVTRHK
jgi:hypothetical protein